MANAINLQPRDITGLDFVGKYGLADTDLVHERIFNGVTRRRCQQRLRLYHEHGLTRVISLSVWNGGPSNRIPTIHCLTERGADAVEAATGLRPLRIARGEPKPETFHHRLAVVKTRLGMDDAFVSAGLEPPMWIMEQDFDPAARADLPPSQRRILYHSFRRTNGPLRTCLPDAASWMKIPRDPSDRSAGTTDLLGYWEIDCSTEGREQVRRKLPGYAALVEHQAYRRYWPEAGSVAIRIFFVCRSAQRIEALCEKLRDIPIAKIARFTTAGELSGATALTKAIWRDVHGNLREILRCPTAATTSRGDS